ncbi:MAG: peroxiredoxin [Pseudomonadota bacterium]
MSISEGASLPNAQLARLGDAGPETVDLNDYIKGRRVILFGLPGAFTGTCSTIHLPSFIATADEFAEQGVDEIICVSVNDPFVMKAWAEASGADAAGITLLADADAAFTKAIGMNFTVPAIGFFDRSNRYAAIVEDGIVTHVNVDEPNTCNVSTGQSLLERLAA